MDEAATMYRQKRIGRPKSEGIQRVTNEWPVFAAALQA